MKKRKNNIISNILQKPKNYKTNAKYFFIFYSFFYSVPVLIDFINLLTTGIYLGDLEIYKIHTRLSKPEIVTIYFFYLIQYCVGVIFYLFFLGHNFVLSSKYEIVIRRNRFESILGLYFIVKIFLAVVFGFDRAGGEARAIPFATLLHLISLDAFFNIYLFIYIDKRNFNYWFLVILYTVLKILQGWSGFVLSFFLWDVFFT